MIRMSDYSTYRIAVTGSTGQLGRELARMAPSYQKFEFIFLSKEEFPLNDHKKMESWIDANPVNIMINCAAFTAVDKAEAEKEKAFQLNAEAPGIIAILLSRTNTPLIYISTDYVFDGNSAAPLKEDAATNPVNVYGASKLEGESQVLQNNPQSLIIRTSWLYSVYGNNFVKTMMRLMKEKTSIKVIEDQKGSPTYAGDLAKAIMEIVESGRFIPGVYHYSNEGETNWFEFATEIKRLSESACEILPIPSSEYQTAAKRPAWSLMDKSKIKKVYGLNIPDWRSSLAICVGLLKKQGL
jgi:dTDP-4-dehydrorhamnose reductase